LIDFSVNSPIHQICHATLKSNRSFVSILKLSNFKIHRELLLYGFGKITMIYEQ